MDSELVSGNTSPTDFAGNSSVVLNGLFEGKKHLFDKIRRFDDALDNVMLYLLRKILCIMTTVI